MLTFKDDTASVAELVLREGWRKVCSSFLRRGDKKRHAKIHQRHNQRRNTNEKEQSICIGPMPAIRYIQ
ncbi:MAG: hypothetical protein AAF335_00490 [Bacteroidota bacterium]